MWLYSLALVLLSICTRISATCSDSDWKTLIGNNGFNIDSAFSAVNSQGDILVGGLMEMQQLKSFTGFIYLLRSSDCSVPW